MTSEHPFKIYFSGAIRAGREDVGYYRELISFLETHGEVLTAFIGDNSLTQMDEPGVTDLEIWERDVRWVAEADILVAEVTRPSLGVGYEIGRAHQVNTPVLALYRTSPDRRLSAMVCGDPNVTVQAYHSIDDLKPHLSNYINRLKA